MPEVAAEFGALYRGWDEARLRALLAPKADVSPSKLRRRLVWMRDKLGACGEPAFMWSHGKRTARFNYPCELGALEVSFTLDAAGRLVSVNSGAAGVAPEPDLLAAAEAVLASLPWASWTWGTSRPFETNLDMSAAIMMGRCTMVRPWVVGQYGGLFHVRCEKGDAALLRLAVHKNGTISEAKLLSSAGNYKGPPVDAPPPSADEQGPAGPLPSTDDDRALD